MLPWHFEAFRRFLTFDVIQQACAALLPFEGEALFEDPSLLSEFTTLLYKRTGMEWLPRREVSDGINFNIEGSVFRNKARIFSSLYLVDPKSFDFKETLAITNFGRAIGLGFVTEQEFYRQILMRYEYPHPAYEENWDAWIAAKCFLRPFIYFMDLMINIYEKDGEGSIAVEEIAQVAFKNPDHKLVKLYSEEILNLRTRKSLQKRTRDDQVDRKIGDILGFMCLSGVTFYDGNKVGLNLIDKHKEEASFFWEKRKGQDRLSELKAIVASATRELYEK